MFTTNAAYMCQLEIINNVDFEKQTTFSVKNIFNNSWTETGAQGQRNFSKSFFT